ncbi:response regulator [Azospirillum aestuarii]|uniref:response regulator n=1 Tax=Azospirillum aestuarii TaxID=2802052 RepID=UPI004054E9DA
MTRRIVVADDHPMFRDAMRSAIVGAVPDAEILEAGTLSTTAEVLENAPDPDLVLLDLNMPGMHGFAGLVYLCAQFPSVPIAVISANEEPRVIRRAIDAGASGYIPKSASSEDMRAALDALLEGEVWVPAGADTGNAADDGDAEVTARIASLTPQQVRVLMMLSDGLINKQIAYELGVSEGTVKAHVSAILQKLGVISRTQAVILARQLAEEADAPQEMVRRAANER